MSSLVSALICALLGIALLVFCARALSAAARCGDQVSQRFIRVHCPLISCLLGASAAVSWVVSAGADGYLGWHFSLTHGAVVVGLALGGVLVIGRGMQLSGAAVAVFWAGSIVALLTVAMRRVTMLDAQALSLAGIILLWLGLPRIARDKQLTGGQKIPAGLLLLAYALSVGVGITAFLAIGSPVSSGWMHGWLIILAALIAVLPAKIGLRGALSAPLWFGSYASLIGLSLVPISNALGTGLRGSLAARASGNPFWLSQFGQSLSANMYMSGSAVLLPDAYALVVLSVVSLFIYFAAMLDRRPGEPIDEGPQTSERPHGLIWRLLGLCLIALAVAFWAVRAASL